MKQPRQLPSVERIRSVLDYDPSTGVFRWKVNYSQARRGDIAGSLNQYGYRRITIDRLKLLAHHLAWFLVKGHWPSGDVDHRNLKPDDNWIDNLRLATRSQNMGNTPVHRDNRSGFKGVWLDKRRAKYCAQICVRGVKRSLGSYDTPEAAHAAYCAAAQNSFGDFARPR